MSECERLPGTNQKRFRRRGPRSLLSIERRSSFSRDRDFSSSEAQPSGAFSETPGGGPCQSGSVLPAIMNKFSFLHFNIRVFLSYKSELEVLLEKYKYPILVALTETFLDPISVKMPVLIGYDVVGRRDRGALRQKKGGINFVCTD